MTHLRLPVHPETYFVDHARGNRVAFSAEDYTVKLPAALTNWIDYARNDIPPQRESKSHIASLALEFGADRPLIDWDIPLDRLGDINHVVQRLEMDETIRPGSGLAPFMASYEPQMVDVPVGYRMSNNTRKQVDMYQSVLRCNQSTVVRHCMALAFVYYNEDVVNGDQGGRWAETLRRYQQEFKAELEHRVEYGREELGMDI